MATLTSVDLQPSLYRSSVRSLGFRLWHVKQAFIRRLESALLPLGLTHMQFMVLRVADHLAQAGEQPTQARLAETMATGRMMVSKILRLLEGKDLVVRPVHPNDARAHHVVLTEAGRALIARSVPVALQAQAEFFGRLGHDRLEQLDAILDEVLLLEGSAIAPGSCSGSAIPATADGAARPHQGPPPGGSVHTRAPGSALALWTRDDVPKRAMRKGQT